jgi:hypothetical protein
MYVQVERVKETNEEKKKSTGQRAGRLAVTYTVRVRLALSQSAL